MPFQLPTERETKTERHTIDLGKNGSFEIEVRRPTWAELSEDSERTRNYMEERLKNQIVGWNGIEQDGASVPYTWEAFQALCVSAPAVFQMAGQIVSSYYHALPEVEEKNSDNPSNDS